MTNVKLAGIIVGLLEKEERCSGYTFEGVLNSLDISRKDETSNVTIDEVYRNFIQIYKTS